jgi:phosphoribosylformylglycinamidine synthase subunit PurS
MIYTVHIKVMPLKDLLDPQGKAIMGGLQNLQLNNITDVRVGKHIELQIEANSKEEAATTATNAAKKLLANAVMEYFEVSVN